MTILTKKDQVRLLISDTGGQDQATFLFTDTEIENFLILEKEDVYSAAAVALRTIAGNEAQLLKVITVLELETDGAKLAAALQNLAKDFDQKSDDQYEFEIVHIGADLFSRRELRRNVMESQEQGEEE